MQPHHQAFEFDFRVTGTGWCEALISDGQRSLLPTASYLFDAPKALLSAVVAVLRGQSPVACIWQEEPGQYVWLFIRQGDSAELRIVWRDRGFAGPSNVNYWFTPSDADITEEAELVIRVAVTDLGRAVVRALEHMLVGEGRTDYEERWTMPFPDREYAELRECLDHRA